MIESHIVDAHVEHYIRSLLPAREGLLLKLEEYANEHHVPIVQPEIAKYIEVLIRLSKPKRILEIGTAIGYSASIMALGMLDGHIDTIELKAEMAEYARGTFESLYTLVPDVSVRIHEGDAMEVLPKLEEMYDIIFIDASKGHYKAFLELCLPKLKPGGILISDNVLYKGMVATNLYLVRRKITIVKRMRAYLNYISSHPLLDTTIVPMGDGIAVSYKKETQ